jgi:hypothetical protein
MEYAQMKFNTTIRRGGGLLVALFVLAGCSQQAQTVAGNCLLAQTNNVDHLFAEVSDKLRDSSCHYSYEDYRERLVSAAKGAPGPGNEARFADLLRQSIDQGIISRRQGQELFSQHFDP